MRIVSQEEFERMLMARKGIDAVLAKYYAARRRMESMAKQIDDLRKRLEKLPADARASEEIRRELDKLRESMQNEAEEIRKSAEHPLPIDLDKNLAPQLKDLAKLTDEMAGELQKFRQDKDLLNKKLAGKLDELAKQLSASRRQYEKNVTAGLEYFEAVFPLLVDRERYAMLALWQREFAERLASLKGRDRDDSPSLKARMRDLEQEQQQILDALSKLLDDIQAHSEKLPDLPELKELRETAQKFVVALHNSGAAEAMTAAEHALADFAPTRGYEKAKQAADILAKFLSQCHGMGNCAGNRLTFHPSLCNSLGNSVAQLLAAMGGQGSGGGGFGMSGFGMGGAEGSIGLYGGLPAMFGRDGERGDAQEVRGLRGRTGPRQSARRKPRRGGHRRKVCPRGCGGRQRGIGSAALPPPSRTVFPTHCRRDGRNGKINGMPPNRRRHVRALREARQWREKLAQARHKGDSPIFAAVRYVCMATSLTPRRAPTEGWSGQSPVSGSTGALGGGADWRWPARLSRWACSPHSRRLGPPALCRMPSSLAASPTASCRWRIWCMRGRRAAAASRITS